MPILNYTTEVDAAKTVAQIQACLVKHGASAIMCEYGVDGLIVALSFKMRVEDNNEMSFRLPSNPRPVLEVMRQDPKCPPRYRTEEQALRVGWRIIKDWVEAQMAIVETRMVKFEQVFLPYIITRDGATLYERFTENRAKLLSND